MFLIVGLGNPGKKYDNTYHNIGFKVLDEYAKSKGVNISKKKEKALIFEGIIDGKKIILIKPQTFMNLSGKSVYALSKRFRVKPSHILVVFDDIDLELGSVRFRQEGSGGTHNGMKDVVKFLNTNKVPRIKMGVGNDPKGKQTLADYVLSNISKQKLEILEESVNTAVELIDEFIANDGQLENKSVN
jgi:PTH1 family peptidyl-tRNA hydrolase